ncbi:MAG: hypothetical protein ACM3N0_01805 [Chloroflexota bacterium]
MADEAKAKARKAVRRAQADFERGQDRLEALRETRRKSFEQARAAGLSMRDIAAETGLHFMRVAQVLKQKQVVNRPGFDGRCLERSGDRGGDRGGRSEMTTMTTWGQLAPRRGAFARLGSVGPELWSERLRCDHERATRHQSAELEAITEEVTDDPAVVAVARRLQRESAYDASTSSWPRSLTLNSGRSTARSRAMPPTLISPCDSLR